MTSVEALLTIRDDVASKLTLNGYVDGIELSESGIDSEEGTMFWYTKVQGRAASEKSQYLVYKISDLEVLASGDGKSLSYRALVTFNYYSTSRTKDQLLLDLDTMLSDTYGHCIISEHDEWDDQNALYRTTLLVGVKSWT